MFFSGIIIISALFVTLISYEYIKQIDGVRRKLYIVLFTSTLGAAFFACGGKPFCTFLSGYRNTQHIIIHSDCFSREVKAILLKQELNTLFLLCLLPPFLLFGMALIYAALGTMQFTAITG